MVIQSNISMGALLHANKQSTKPKVKCSILLPSLFPQMKNYDHETSTLIVRLSVSVFYQSWLKTFLLEFLHFLSEAPFFCSCANRSQLKCLKTSQNQVLRFFDISWWVCNGDQKTNELDLYKPRLCVQSKPVLEITQQLLDWAIPYE